MPAKEVILKKLEQIKALLAELAPSLALSLDTFTADMKTIRSAERIFQLLVDLAIDINTALIMEKSGKTPDTYRQSFLELSVIGIMPADLARDLAKTASVRNILVHEYDFEEDYAKFYAVAKECIPLYEEYCSRVYAFVTESN